MLNIETIPQIIISTSTGLGTGFAISLTRVLDTPSMMGPAIAVGYLALNAIFNTPHPIKGVIPFVATTMLTYNFMCSFEDLLGIPGKPFAA